jgi:hypothetical protein
MTRVLTCLGMVSVLLLTNFVTNVYAVETSGLGVPSSGEFNEVKITLSGFPGQTGESVTDVDLTPSPCNTQFTCTGFSDITIPGIGDGHILVTLQEHHQGQHKVLDAVIYGIIAVALATLPIIIHSINIPIFGPDIVTRTINIPDIGTGQITIQLI